MFKKVKIILISLLFSSLLSAQGSAGSNAKFEYRFLIDMPTAGVLEKGYLGVDIDLMPNGVVITEIEVGALNNFSFGISYGASNLIGSGNIDWYKWPGIDVRARIFDESESIPAFTLGFDSQGKGQYLEESNRYEIKSPGFFLAASKNFDLFGYLSIHGTLNYTLERSDDDKDLNFSFGVEKTLGGQVSITAEYNFALNDNNPLSLGSGKGYLNFGARWSITQGFTIGLDVRDLLNNQKLDTYSADRGIYIEYITSIF